jgi:ectoine hydroxylase-related dioxygenase (phytanoyl-CoA dioxygenase family)
MVLDFIDDGSELKMSDPREIAPIIHFCAQPKLFSIISRYIGEFPVVSNMSLIYTRQNETVIGPQKWHRDTNAPRQLHLVIPIWDIDELCGPFTLLPGDKSRDVIHALGHNHGRVEDDVFEKFGVTSDIVKLIGVAGTAYLVNPYACFHYGARARTKPRLMLIVNFSSLFEGAEGMQSPSRSANKAALDDGRFETRCLVDL